MTDRMPNLLYSEHCGHFSQDEVGVEVFIVKLEGGRYWTLEVVNANGTSIVWDETFLDDQEAYAEFQRTVAEEGMEAFLDQNKVIPFRGR